MDEVFFQLPGILADSTPDFFPDAAPPTPEPAAFSLRRALRRQGQLASRFDLLVHTHLHFPKVPIDPLRLFAHEGLAQRHIGVHLQYVDSDVALRQSLMREQTERINRYLREMQMSVNEQIEAARKLALAAEGAPQGKSGWFGGWWGGIGEKVRGGISEDPRELKKYLIHSTQP